jgi:hypothetical protein
MQQEEMPDVAQAKVGATSEKPAPEPFQVIEKRKTRSQGSAEELKLLALKEAEVSPRVPLPSLAPVEAIWQCLRRPSRRHRLAPAIRYRLDMFLTD